MADFTQQISDFERNGVYNYRFDDVGNQILNPSSSIFEENYVAFPLTNVYYNQDRILSFYNPNFTEFSTSSAVTASSPVLPDTLQQQLDETALQNQVLQQQLTDLIQTTQADSTTADTQAVKDVIIQLRIQLGQGTQDSDFSEDFPYLPKPQ